MTDFKTEVHTVLDHHGIDYSWSLFSEEGRKVLAIDVFEDNAAELLASLGSSINSLRRTRVPCSSVTTTNSHQI